MTGLFNAALLEGLRGTSIADLGKVSACNTVTMTPQACFSTLLYPNIPLAVVLTGAVLGLLFGVLYGMYYEYLPGNGYPIKAVGLGLLLLVFMIIVGGAGNYTATDETELAILRAFDTVAMLGYAFILSRLYRRLTREVQFDSPSPDKLKISVDGRNFTDKTKTLGIHSSHTIKAPQEKGLFHQWLVSGGVTVEDPKSPETKMKVDGDGLLKIT